MGNRTKKFLAFVLVLALLAVNMIGCVDGQLILETNQTHISTSPESSQATEPEPTEPEPTEPEPTEPEPTEPAPQPDVPTEDDWFYIAVAAVVLILIGLIAMIIGKKKKRR